MLPMKAVRTQFGALLAADPTTLAQATNANVIALFNQPVALSENLTVASLSFATFTGSNDINVPIGAQGVGIDPITLQQIITILAPAGGYRWTCSVAPTTPETIYGYALLTKAHAALLAVQLFNTPEVISQVGNVIDIGSALITLVLQPAS